MCSERNFKGAREKLTKKKNRKWLDLSSFLLNRSKKTVRMKPFLVILFADFSRVPIKSRSDYIERLGSSKSIGNFGGFF